MNLVDKVRGVTNPGSELGRLAEAAHALSLTLRRSGEHQVGLDPLPGSEWDVVQFVITHPDTPVSDVARALRLQTSNVSTTVRTLVRRGLVEQVPDARDQRRRLLRATARAEEHRELLQRSWARSIDAALAGLPPEQAEAVRTAAPVLGRLAELLLLPGAVTDDGKRITLGGDDPVRGDPR